MPIESRVEGGIAEIVLAVNKVNALDIASTLGEGSVFTVYLPVLSQNRNVADA